MYVTLEQKCNANHVSVAAAAPFAGGGGGNLLPILWYVCLFVLHNLC